MKLSATELTDAQREAAAHFEGPLLILAGPGSGKTRVVTYRIAKLLHEGVPSRQVLALTFTNKAADEMRRRVEQMVPGTSVWISTFHRFCSRLLRQHASLVGLRENFTIYDMADSARAMRLVLEGRDDLNLSKITPTKLLHAISKCKNNLITAEHYEPWARDTVAVLLRDIYPAYQRQLVISNAVDFDDLLLHTVELLRNNEALRSELDERYRFVMVDEYQDTNLAQYAIARALCVDHPNLTVTGDPDQSIYAWRGANIQNILGFERDYPHVKVVRLEHNFRSTPEILVVADELIQFNRQRKKKSLIPVRSSQQRVRLCAFPSQLDESRYIAEEISALVAKGAREYRDFAIFYRVNALSRYLEHTLREHDVPYQVLNGVEFYQRKEVKDVLAYLQLINNPQDDVAFMRVINTPPRGLGHVTLAKLAALARERQCALLETSRTAAAHLSKRAAKAVGRFVEMFDQLRRYTASPVEEILGHVLTASGYEDFVKENDERADEDRSANIRELLTAARQFDMLHQGTDYLEAYLEQTSLASDTDAWEETLNKVSLMTLHSAKGLEFPVVYLVAAEQGKLPHERSLDDPDQLEEERRLMFVGITRAQDALTISYARYRDYRGQLSPTVASSFLMELPRDQMECLMGDVLGLDEYHAGLDELDEDAADFDPSSWEADESPVAAPTADRPSTSWGRLTTAADLDDNGNESSNESVSESSPLPSSADPNDFAQGMRVTHPEYGLGKIVALSGTGKGRTATVNFATAGQKKFVLAKSTLRPLA